LWEKKKKKKKERHSVRKSRQSLQKGGENERGKPLKGKERKKFIESGKGGKAPIKKKGGVSGRRGEKESQGNVKEEGRGERKGGEEEL